MSLTTPAARRDLAYHLHPSTNLRSVQTEGPLVITRGEGVYVYDDEAGAISTDWPGYGALRSGSRNAAWPTPRTGR